MNIGDGSDSPIQDQKCWASMTSNAVILPGTEQHQCEFPSANRWPEPSDSGMNRPVVLTTVPLQPFGARSISKIAAPLFTGCGTR